ncbi:zeta toxin family protein [Rhodococcus sp. USK13]|uniref:zeta toxin family protein n=1 Tax=Rhodococcus sp. USK13 TaxID=2806442 RepID=UPI001BD18F56|nr:zeta toxin family protein [Rhodococcus sp. USK13]
MPPPEFEDRRAFLASLSIPGGPLTIDAPHATINDRRYFRRIKGDPVPTGARLRLHERILADWRASRTQVRRDRVLILMAGPPGAGKSTAPAHMVGGRAQGWRHLDADEFKLRLLQAAVEDGSVQQLLPEELRAQPGQPSRFYPNELSALVHIESNLLLERALTESLSVGENVIIDGTMAWKPWATELVTRLEREHYTIHVADVEASQEIATARVVHRWQQGLTAALTTSDADPATRMGGRWLPLSAVDRLFTDTRLPDGTPLHGMSVSEVNAREVSEESLAVSRYDLYRTVAVDRGPEHIERRERTAGGQLERTWGELDSPNPADRAPASESDRM